MDCRDALRQFIGLVSQTPMALFLVQMAGDAVVQAGDVVDPVFVSDADRDDVNHRGFTLPSP